MNRIFKTFLVALSVFALSVSVAHGQTTTTKTSLNADLAGGASNNVLTLVSVTGITASTTSTQTFVYLPGEEMQVQSVNSSLNQITVRRAARGNAVPHLSTEPVWYGVTGSFNGNTGNTTGVFVSANPIGACTRTANQYLPVINPNSGDITDCILSPAIGSPTAAAATTSRWFSFNLTQTRSALPYKKLAVSATTYTLLPTDTVLGVNTNVNTTITIPALTGWVGKEFIVQLEITGTQSITIQTSSNQTINGAASIVIGGSTNFSGVRIYSDGVNWFTSRAQ